MTFSDPLGIAQGVKNNLPEIAEAFRSTGTVCVERTLRILNRKGVSNQLINSSEDIPERIKQTFGRTGKHRGSHSVGRAGGVTASAIAA